MYYIETLYDCCGFYSISDRASSHPIRLLHTCEIPCVVPLAAALKRGMRDQIIKASMVILLALAASVALSFRMAASPQLQQEPPCQETSTPDVYRRPLPLAQEIEVAELEEVKGTKRRWEPDIVIHGNHGHRCKRICLTATTVEAATETVGRANYGRG